MRALWTMPVIAGALALPVTSARANCIPAKLPGTFNEANEVNIDMGPGVFSSQVVGANTAIAEPSPRIIAKKPRGPAAKKTLGEDNP